MGIRTIILFIIVTGLLVSCNKEKRWKTSVAISNINSYSADLQIDFDYRRGSKSIRNIHLGIVGNTFGSFEVSPTENFEHDGVEVTQEKKDHTTLSYNNSNLFANNTYYIQSYIAKGRDTV